MPKKVSRKPRRSIKKTSKLLKRSKKAKRSPISSKSRKPKGLKLISIKKSPRAEKKLMATFSDGTVTHFGAAGMSDYTKHKDPERMNRYKARHKARENWSSPKTAGSLSRWILWNKPSLKASISDFKRRFKL